jgi:hypothetical protein
MNHPYIDYQFVKQRHQEDIAAAERYRLAARAQRAQRAERTSFTSAPSAGLVFLSLARMLSFIGNRLLAWSCRLQGRYQILVSADASRRVKPCV